VRPAWRVAALVLLALPLAGAAREDERRSSGALLRVDVERERIFVLESGSEVPYDVRLEGAWRSRTLTTLEGKGARLAELPAGARVVVYWTPLGGDAEPLRAGESRRRAHRVDSRAALATLRRP